MFSLPPYASYIFTISFGAFIGYGTNWLAIKMLFRPLKPHYLFGKKLPFTPGIIPKEKGRIAASIGEAVSQNLMNEEVLRDTLLGEKIMDKITTALDQFVAKLQQEPQPLGGWLSSWMKPEQVDAVRQSVVSEMSQMVTENLVGADLGQKIAHIAVDHAIAKLQGGVMGLFHVDKILENLRAKTESLLAQNIDEMLRTEAPAMVSDMVGKGVTQLMDTPVSTLLKGREEQLAALRSTILDLYRKTVEQQLPAMLATLDVKQMIEDRINAMDVLEVEHLIFDVMDKELSAIVLLGLGLGFLLGCANCIFL